MGCRFGQPDDAGLGFYFLTAAWRVSGTGGARRAGLRRRPQGGGALQTGEDLRIGDLREPGVELPDGGKASRRADADHLVGIGADPCLPPGRRDGHGEHDPRRPQRPGDLAGGPGRGPGGDAVIDHHGHPPVQPPARPPGPVARGAGFHCRLLPRLDRRQLVLRHPAGLRDLGVDDPHPVLPDRAHAQLGLERHPQLAHDDDIQRRAQRPGHPERDRDPAPRQAQHHDRLAAQMPQPGREPPPRIITISEHHHNSSWKAFPQPGGAARDHSPEPGPKALAIHPGRELHGEGAGVFSRFDRLFDQWARMMPFRPMAFPRWLEAGDLIRVEEYRDDGTLVVRADLPGIDADKDVELTVAGGMPHIEAERRQEEKRRATCGVRCATGRCLGRCRYRRA